MSLPREWNLQDSRGSLYCPSESHPAGRVEHQSGRFICSSTDNLNGDGSAAGYNSSNNTIGGNSAIEPHSIIPDLPPLASSQPTAPSLLTECQQSCGSLFSVVSAPPLAELDVNKVAALSGGINSSGYYPLSANANITVAGCIGGGVQSAVIGLSSSTPHATALGGSIEAPTLQQHHLSATTIPRRPVTLPIGMPYSPAAGGAAQTASRTLHASLLEHQISEIEEDDNENLLTVSSITARPLIAKSREICTKRQQRAGSKQWTSRRPGSGGSVSITAGDGVGGSGDGGGNGGVTGVGNRRLRENEAASSSRSSENADPPDGGYGWVIVFGAFSVQFWVAGLVKSYGVLYVEIMETFESSTATVASWIPAILSALCLALAPLSSALCQRFSCRSVVFVGGLFCAFGLTLSYFATSLLHLLFTFGILTGIGGGLSTTPGIVIVSQYFDKHRALANGICVSGTAVGSFILPVLIKHLAEKFGFHGTILILGVCMFHVCFSAMLYKPLEQYNNSQNTDEADDDDADDDAAKDDCSRPLNNVNPSSAGILTNSTYLDTCDSGVTGGGASNARYIEHLFMEETKNRLNDYYSGKHGSNAGLSTANAPQAANVASQQESDDDEVKDMIGETTFIKPMKKVRSSGIMHSVEDLSTDSTWVYRKHSGTDSNRGSRRRRNVFANDEIISKIQAHLEKPLAPPVVVTRGLSKSMEIPTPVSNLTELKDAPPTECLNGGNGVAHAHRSNAGNRAGGGGDGVEIDVDELEDDDVPRTCCERIETYLDISLLKDPTFILMCLSVTLMSVGCPYMLYYLPAHVISIGYNKSEAGYLVAVSAVLDLCGRLGLGWLSDLQLFDRRKTYVLCILGAGVAVLTIPSADTLLLIGLSAATYGACLGSWYVLMPVLLADIFGTDRISSSYGLVRMFQSIGAISVPPLAGYLRDLSGSYAICFYCMGSCMVLGCVPLLIWALLEHREQRRLLNATRSTADSDEHSTVS